MQATKSKRAAALFRQKIDMALSAPILAGKRMRRPRRRRAPDFRLRSKAPIAVREAGFGARDYLRGGRGFRERARAHLTLSPTPRARRGGRVISRSSGRRRRSTTDRG